MRKWLFLFLCCALAVSFTGLARAADDNPLAAGQTKVFTEEFASVIPKDKILTVDQFHAVWEKAMGDKAYRDSIYMIDVRSHPEFYAFHIQGTDMISSGHVYTIPKKITDPNAEIYIF